MPIYHDGGTSPEAFRGNDKAFDLAMCGFRFSFKSCVEAESKLTKRIFELVKQRGNRHETEFHRFLVSRPVDLPPLDHVRGDSRRSLARAIMSAVPGVRKSENTISLFLSII
jgi:hypothetical protein